LGDWVINEIRGKLKQFQTATYYDVLGVDRLANVETIRRAYYDLELMLESFRTRWPAQHEMNSQLNDLLAAINKAYQTLIDPERRHEYDAPAGQKREAAAPAKKTAPNGAPPRVPLPVPIPRPIPIPIPAPVARPRPTSGPHPITTSSTPAKAPAKINPAQPNRASTPAVSPNPVKIPTASPLPPSNTPAFAGLVDPYVPPQQPSIENAIQAAAEKYQQGRSRFERRDFHAAAFLLREAARLDPSRAEHHYILARTLTVLSQARHMHDGHEGCHVTCNLGGALIRNQKVRYEAVQHFREAARLDPQNAKLRVELGQLYKDAGMQKKADACFWEALLLDGKDPDAMQELGLDGQVEVARSENPLAKRTARKPGRKTSK
jgi:tetratricopeptide (TPR) repeat protein